MELEAQANLKLTAVEILLPTQQYSYATSEICQSFLKKHHIDFFAYIKTYYDKSCCVLTTHPKLFEYLYKNNLSFVAPIPNELVKNQFHYLVPHNGPYNKVMHEVAANFKLFKPLDLIFLSKDYFELFCFGVNKDNDEVTSYYLNHLFEFQQFCSYFQEKAFTLMQSADTNRILLSDPVFDVVKHLIPIKGATKSLAKTLSIHELKMILDRKREIKRFSHLSNHKHFDLMVDNSLINLSRREFECLQCLLQGLSAQETAESLFLSKRTVEDHLENIKDKTYSKSKLELVSKIYQSLLSLN